MERTGLSKEVPGLKESLIRDISPQPVAAVARTAAWQRARLHYASKSNSPRSF